ncbi:MAG: hypothetical protein KBS81_00985, partial [Spirochaetales bacterium]|nr:hypothetical protein [Candidatus Physcosoma equi]
SEANLPFSEQWISREEKVKKRQVFFLTFSVKSTLFYTSRNDTLGFPCFSLPQAFLHALAHPS